MLLTGPTRDEVERQMDTIFGRPAGSGVYFKDSEAPQQLAPIGLKTKVERVHELSKESPEVAELFDRTYPSILKHRIDEADWHAIIDKVNQYWSPIVEESKRMKKHHSLLSYTILSIPKNVARMKRFEQAYAAARHHITYFLEMVNENIRDRGIAFTMRVAEEGPLATHIEIRREKRNSMIGSSVGPKAQPQKLKKEEKWWHFSNEDILATLHAEEETFLERTRSASNPTSPSELASPHLPSPGSTSPDRHYDSDKSKNKHSPSQPQQRGERGRARSHTIGGPTQHTDIAPPMLDLTGQRPFVQQPPSPQAYQPLSMVSPSVGNPFLPQPVLQQPIILSPQPQPVLYQQQQHMLPLQQPVMMMMPTPQPTPTLAVPTQLMAGSDMRRGRSLSTDSRPSSMQTQRDLITW